MLIRTEETQPLLRSPLDALSRPLRDLRLFVLDRYSEIRDLQSAAGKRPEMYRMGG